MFEVMDFVLDNPCDYLMGFNINFDLQFIYRACERSKITPTNLLPYKVIDPFTIGQAMILSGLLPNLRQTSLKGFCNHFDIEITENNHEAVTDINLTYNLWDAMSKRLSKV
jgi:DNA polymerase III epsilon subunit-like protein